MINSRQLFLNYVAQTSDSPLMLEVERAKGVYLFSADGKKYFDLISGISVSNVGHCHPRVVDAIGKQAAKYMHLMVYGEYIQHPQVALAQKLVQHLPEKLNNIFFVNSGSEAVEGAIKLAKRFTGRSEVISFKNAYHGSTHGALSLMGNEEQKRAFRPLLPDIKQLNFNCIENLQDISHRTACVIIEPTQGEAGVIVADMDFIGKLCKKCDETGTLLIFDEIQTGLGRTGRMFAFEKYDVIPDILLLAKALGGGMPLGAFISSKKIMSTLSFNPALGHITTFGGHPVCCASALESLQIMIDENLIEQVQTKAMIFEKILRNHPLVREIRSNGLLMAVQLDTFEQVQKIIKTGLELGVVLDWFLFCNTAFRLAPPLIITEDECRESAEIILEALNRI